MSSHMLSERDGTIVFRLLMCQMRFWGGNFDPFGGCETEDQNNLRTLVLRT
jgi:hypothetical protein